MKDRNILIWNMIAFTLLSFLVAGFQTSFWPAIFRVLSGANLWIFLTLYICIYRSLTQALAFIYINTLALHAFTNLPIGLFLSLQILLLLLCVFLRSRIFWNTTSYYLIISAVGVLFYEISFMILSYFFESVPAEHFAWRETLVTLALSPAFGFLFFTIGRFIDSLLPLPQIGAAKT